MKVKHLVIQVSLDTWGHFSILIVMGKPFQFLSKQGLSQISVCVTCLVLVSVLNLFRTYVSKADSLLLLIGACLGIEASRCKTSSTKMHLTLKEFATVQRCLVHTASGRLWAPKDI